MNEQLTQIRTALGLLHSIILSGERMSPQADTQFAAALQALSVLERASQKESPKP